MGGLCSGTPATKKNKDVKKDKEKKKEIRRKTIEESKENNNGQISTIRRISNPRIDSLSNKLLKISKFNFYKNLSSKIKSLSKKKNCLKNFV